LIVRDSANDAFYGLGASGWQLLGGGSQALPEIVHIKDVKSAGTNGGTCTPDTYIQRTINTLENPNSYSWASLSSNQFTLTAGTYLIDAVVPASQGQGFKAKLRNVTDSADSIIGTSGYTIDIQSHSFIRGVVVLTGSKVFQIHHRCDVSVSANDLGQAGATGDDEVYTNIQITKLH
jgi:hypothetical protein